MIRRQLWTARACLCEQATVEESEGDAAGGGPCSLSLAASITSAKRRKPPAKTCSIERRFDGEAQPTRTWQTARRHWILV